MPTLLSDPSPTFYLILVAAAVITGAVAAKNQDRKSMIPFAVALGILLLVFAVDKLVESSREEAVRRVHAMVQAANDRDPAAFVDNVADKVEYRGSGSVASVMTREELRTGNFWNVFREHNVRAAVWDFSRDDVAEPGPDRIEIGFMAKGEAEGKPFPAYFRATFTRQPNGQMRLSSFATFDPVQRANKPEPIPGFPR